jgi:uncharacterized protein (UPF0335 family)
MANGTQAASGKAAGRKGRDKQEAVTKPEVVAEKIEHLERLAIKANEAAKDLSDAIKTLAEVSGYNASAIKALVAARVGDKFADKRRNAEQQLELFDEVGE